MTAASAISTLIDHFAIRWHAFIALTVSRSQRGCPAIQVRDLRCHQRQDQHGRSNRVARDDPAVRQHDEIGLPCPPRVSSGENRSSENPSPRKSDSGNSVVASVSSVPISRSLAKIDQSRHSPRSHRRQPSPNRGWRRTGLIRRGHVHRAIGSSSA